MRFSSLQLCLGFPGQKHRKGQDKGKDVAPVFNKFFIYLNKKGRREAYFSSICIQKNDIFFYSIPIANSDTKNKKPSLCIKYKTVTPAAPFISSICFYEIKAGQWVCP